MNIYVCEDSEIQRKFLVKTIEEYRKEKTPDIQIKYVGSDPYEVIKLVEQENDSSLYFLDVDLNTDINGIELAEKIRNFDMKGSIVFITNHPEFTSMTFEYKIEALDYIVKDDLDKMTPQISDCISKAFNKRNMLENEGHNCLMINSKDKKVKVSYQDIIIIETLTTPHKVMLTAENRRLEIYANLKDLMKQLDERFIRCHQSAIINSEKIQEIDYKNMKLVLTNGQNCVLSYVGLKLLKKKFQP
ncbi:LytR/AlgR family response regulator transcription factor [Anaeromicropila herbilytica]|uniref:Stage 0 sporulation protein A homolog n=1 Tax=Anaeromicropila herbilytica TaxID=2785025 RepID=A0A7R7EK26_9FIRM|nr:LytTR family DNA-binding domain-containing protein [Anaeromicropila herbilytica]BCN29897.1 DNA-binding response regulator [Anaeromicropila herbilytica]